MPNEIIEKLKKLGFSQTKELENGQIKVVHSHTMMNVNAKLDKEGNILLVDRTPNLGFWLFIGLLSFGLMGSGIGNDNGGVTMSVRNGAISYGHQPNYVNGFTIAILILVVAVVQYFRKGEERIKKMREELMCCLSDKK